MTLETHSDIEAMSSLGASLRAAILNEEPPCER
jgi:hypothetical protein